MLKISETRFFLLCPSKVESEERHVSDVLWGIFCLESIGVLPQQIHLFIDASDFTLLNQMMKQATVNSYTINDSSNFIGLLASENSYKNVFVFVTGHGDYQGIEGRQVITPHLLTSSLLNNQHLEKAVVFLGQCYAGIFNHVDIRSKKDLNGKLISPEIVLAGATNLFESLSSSLNEKMLGDKQVSWIANSFLAYCFNWLRFQIDIDGDGHPTVMDCFKFAGAMSNSKNQNAKSLGLDSLLALYEALKVVNEAIGRIIDANQQQQLQQLLLERMTLKKRINEQRNIGFVHQEPWILNSFVAQSFIIS